MSIKKKNDTYFIFTYKTERTVIYWFMGYTDIELASFACKPLLVS